ncbi:MAG TPA: acetoacetate--CoA ligase [Rhodocyclaceae bacterium]|nr:acetoacetate--CoA ligase [Rhodocyclaceae bacterium]
MDMQASRPLWRPSPERIDGANLSAFMAAAGKRWHRDFADFATLHRWSVARPEEFWLSLWEFCDVIGEPGTVVVADADRMPGARWFPDARLNFAENLLRWRDDGEAMVFWGENRLRRRLSRADVYQRVARLAAAMRAEGVQAGDRVAAYMPNMPETIITALAAASIGAVFTSASPDFGVQGVLDRFGQVEPKLLFVADGYYYGGKTIDCLPRVAEIAGRLPSLRKTVVARYVRGQGHDLSGIANGVMLRDFVDPFRDRTEIVFERLPFAHPLYIVYSSGTTGVPKCIVHSAGGVLLQHLKEHRLHGDIRPGDRLFYFTTCGWMMWNWLASGLASGATLLLYDGSPLVDHGRIVFDCAEVEGMTHLGTSAKYIDSIAKSNLRPKDSHDLSALRVIFSTGSPLAPEAFDYVYGNVQKDVQLASISGGTDILSCFVGGNPLAPVYRGEIQCAGLGMATDVFDDGGQPVVGQKGELVCTRPFPAMPIGFWNDPDGARYRAAYFERFPGVWCHGDFALRTERDGFVIYGRSDATLNPGGVRIGTAEIYRQVEKLPEVMEALAIGQQWPPGEGSDVRVVLFVRLREGLALDEALVRRIKQTIRDNTSPRHVPARVVQVNDIPRTRSGKIVELAVRNVVHGLPVKNLEALANPEALEDFRQRPELAS